MHLPLPHDDSPKDNLALAPFPGAAAAQTPPLPWTTFSPPRTDLPFQAQIAKSKATGDNTLFWEAHRVGQRRPYWHMEQLTNLGALPPHGFEVAVFPLRIVGVIVESSRNRTLRFWSWFSGDAALREEARDSRAVNLEQAGDFSGGFAPG